MLVYFSFSVSTWLVSGEHLWSTEQGFGTIGLTIGTVLELPMFHVKPIFLQSMTRDNHLNKIWWHLRTISATDAENILSKFILPMKLSKCASLRCLINIFTFYFFRYFWFNNLLYWIMQFPPPPSIPLLVRL